MENETEDFVKSSTEQFYQDIEVIKNYNMSKDLFVKLVDAFEEYVNENEDIQVSTMVVSVCMVLEGIQNSLKYESKELKTLRNRALFVLENVEKDDPLHPLNLEGFKSLTTKDKDMH